ncbi:PLP-dependent aspartate aminotransferase family protein [Gottschalkiaceae bacterium SANA]|nr:PLP-dependent aspartate aminotransferase family protein [Gottschalkiaceae bacterium SANA]
MEMNSKNFETNAVHAGQHPDGETGALVSPLYLTSTYVWTPEKMERYLAGDKEGIFTYGRSRNPTQNMFQTKIATLEGGEAALATGSGMAAISLALLGTLHAGDHMISSGTVYGGTYALMTKIFEEMNIEVTFVSGDDKAEMEAALRPNTKIVYLEAMLNPTIRLNDIPMMLKFAKDNNLMSIVDNTFPTPYLFRPLEHGADLVVHSTTKYINGHGDHVGGIIVGGAEYIEKLRSSIYQELGPVPSPFACWLGLRGAKTLHLRMRQHCESAMTLAKWLMAHPKVVDVSYPGLENHPQHELAKSIFTGKGFGGLVSFTIDGGIPEAQKVINELHMAQYCVSLGDLDTLVQHPATMTHGKIEPDERARMGIPDGMIRISVGIENVEDIIADFEQALEKF